MKHWFPFISAGVLAAGLVFAQGHPGLRSGHAPGDRQQRMERHFEMLSTYLNLTEAQREQAKSIFGAARQSAEPAARQLREGHQALAEAVKTGKSEAELTQLANAQGALIGQMIAIHSAALSKFYAILTPEQKDKAGKLHEHLKGMFESHFGPGL